MQYHVRIDGQHRFAAVVMVFGLRNNERAGMDLRGAVGNKRPRQRLGAQIGPETGNLSQPHARGIGREQVMILAVG